MSWNYRVVRKKFDKEEGYYIYEVYYDNRNKITMYSVEPMYIYGASFEELKADLELYKEALNKPIIDWEDLKKIGGE